MKKVVFFLCLFFFINNGALFSQSHSHSHDHAPGHCPACNFDPAQAAIPTSFEGTVEDWHAKSTEGDSTSVMSLLLVLGAGAALASVLVLKKFQRIPTSS